MTQSFVLGGGCFWCLDAIYRRLRGVQEVEVGFAGGALPNPSLDAVSTGTTGHAEVVRVTFEPELVSPSTILDVFFAFHDPTQRDRQGDDIGSHYRSALFYTDDAQRELFERSLASAAQTWGAPVVTQVSRLDAFYPADASQQDFFNKNPGNAYCEAITGPKVVRLRKSFAHLLSDKA
jgi:peptide-methionine (S)-S-oxide reductase